MFTSKVLNLSSKLPVNKQLPVYVLSTDTEPSCCNRSSHRIGRKPKTFKDACTEICFKLSKNLEEPLPLLGRGEYTATFWVSESLRNPQKEDSLLPYCETHA